MTLRTRMAVMVILFLLGCVFVAPYYRTVTGHSDSSESGALTLQIQRPPTSDIASSVTPGLSQTPAVSGGPYALNTAKNVATNAAPFPVLQMPPPLDLAPGPVARPQGEATNQQTMSQRDAATLPGYGQLPPRPVRLIGHNIGTDASWMHSPSANGALPRQVPMGQVPARQNRRIDQPAGTNLYGNVEHRNDLGSFQWRRPSANAPPNSKFAAVQSVPMNPATARPDSIAGSVHSGATRRETFHRVVNGDSLAALSQQYYGRPDRGLMIFAANRRQLVHPEILPIGMELVIPPAR